MGNTIKKLLDQTMADFRAVIVDDIKANPATPYEQIAVKHGVSFAFIHATAIKAGIRRQRRKADSEAVSNG